MRVKINDDTGHEEDRHVQLDDDTGTVTIHLEGVDWYIGYFGHREDEMDIVIARGVSRDELSSFEKFRDEQLKDPEVRAAYEAEAAKP